MYLIQPSIKAHSQARLLYAYFTLKNNNRIVTELQARLGTNLEPAYLPPEAPVSNQDLYALSGEQTEVFLLAEWSNLASRLYSHP